MTANARLRRLIELLTEDEAEAVLARYEARGHSLAPALFSGEEFGGAIVASLSEVRRRELLSAVDNHC